jgi:putative ABC transport system ATP-binding protein
MMSDGRIVLDLKGKQREGLGVEDLLRLFRDKANKRFDNDRILLSTMEGD